MDTLKKCPSMEEIYAHYGYTNQNGWHSNWPNEPGQINRLSDLPDFIKAAGLDKQRFRVTFDYDPNYPNMLLQATTEFSSEEIAPLTIGKWR